MDPFCKCYLFRRSFCIIHNLFTFNLENVYWIKCRENYLLSFSIYLYIFFPEFLGSIPKMLTTARGYGESKKCKFFFYFLTFAFFLHLCKKHLLYRGKLKIGFVNILTIHHSCLFDENPLGLALRIKKKNLCLFFFSSFNETNAFRKWMVPSKLHLG